MKMKQWVLLVSMVCSTVGVQAKSGALSPSPTGSRWETVQSGVQGGAFSPRGHGSQPYPSPSPGSQPRRVARRATAVTPPQPYELALMDMPGDSEPSPKSQLAVREAVDLMKVRVEAKKRNAEVKKLTKASDKKRQIGDIFDQVKSNYGKEGARTLKGETGSDFSSHEWHKAFHARPEEKEGYDGYDSQRGSRLKAPLFSTLTSTRKPHAFYGESSGWGTKVGRSIQNVKYRFAARHPVPLGIKNMIYAALAYGTDAKVQDDFDMYKEGIYKADDLRDEYGQWFKLFHQFKGNNSAFRMKSHRAWLDKQWVTLINNDVAGNPNFKLKGLSTYIGNLMHALTQLRRAQFDDFAHSSFTEPTFTGASDKSTWSRLADNREFTRYLFDIICDIDPDTGTLKTGIQRTGLAVRNSVSRLLGALPHHSEWHGLGASDHRPEAYQARWEELLGKQPDYCTFVLPVIFHLLRLRNFLGMDVPYYTKGQLAIARYSKVKSAGKWGAAGVGVAALAAAGHPAAAGLAITGGTVYGAKKVAGAIKAGMRANKNRRSIKDEFFGADVDS